MKYLINPAEIYRPIRRITRLQIGEQRVLLALYYTDLPLTMDGLMYKRMRIHKFATNEQRDIRASLKVLLDKNLVIETPGKPSTYKISLEGMNMVEKFKQILNDFKLSTNLI